MTAFQADHPGPTGAATVPAHPSRPTVWARGGGSTHGFIIPLVALAALSIALFLMVISSLGQSSRSRITHLNKAQTTFHIAYSAQSRFMARLHMTSWANRDYRDRPVREFRIPLFGGEYDLYAENTPGLNREYQTDLYIRVRFADMTRLYFWRFRYRDDLLDLSDRASVLYFAGIPLDQFPSGAGSSFGSKVDRILATREANRSTADELSMIVQGVHDVRRIADLLGHSAPNATNTAEFARPPEIILAGFPGLPTIPFPTAQTTSYADSPLTPPTPAPPPSGAPAPPPPPGSPPPSTPPSSPPPSGSPTPPPSQPGRPPEPAPPPRRPPVSAPPSMEDPLTPPTNPPELPTRPPNQPDPRDQPGQDQVAVDVEAALALFQQTIYWIDNAGRHLVNPSNSITEADLVFPNDPFIREQYARYLEADAALGEALKALYQAVKAGQQAAPLAEVAGNPGARSTVANAVDVINAQMPIGKASIQDRASAIGLIKERIDALKHLQIFATWPTGYTPPPGYALPPGFPTPTERALPPKR